MLFYVLHASSATHPPPPPSPNPPNNLTYESPFHEQTSTQFLVQIEALWAINQSITE